VDEISAADNGQLFVGFFVGFVDFRHGIVFIEYGQRGSTMTLGATAWVARESKSGGRNIVNVGGLGNSSRQVRDDLARHEAFHSRQVATLGEFGFYFTYLTFGTLWAAAQGGPWNKAAGNPFEETASTPTRNPAPVPASKPNPPYPLVPNRA
jgi:hypothetical protein